MRKYGKNKKHPEASTEKQPSAKSALLHTYFASLLSLVLCVCMFCGTSYAWFTNEVQNEGNEIYIGQLKVDLLMNGTSLHNSDTKVFDNTHAWEPGQTVLRTLQVKNLGNLAFRYVLELKKPEGSTTDATDAAAEWFDVWCYHDAENKVPTPQTYDQITESDNWEYVGSLKDVLNGEPVFRGSMTKDDVANNAETTHTYTIALHMNGETIPEDQQEDFNKLMGKSINLDVKLMAYQMSSEPDSFNGNYDLEAFAGTLAKVKHLGAQEIPKYTWGIGGAAEATPLELDTTFQFQPTETSIEAQKTPYRKYIADYVVSADKDVPGDSMALAGYYSAWCDSLNNGNWVALKTPDTIPAGEEIRLISTMGNGLDVTYEMLCEFGNDGVGFLCGAADLTGENAGTTLTVQLRLYEVVNDGTGNAETGKFIIVDTYTHTFTQESTESTESN